MNAIHFQPRSKQVQLRAFTLIELLVTMGIIILLAGVFLPVLVSSKNKARNAQCLSQLKQLGIAARLYAEDNNGVLTSAELLPSNPTDPQKPLPRICDLLGRYVGSIGNTNVSALVFKCPRDNDWFYEVEGSSYQWNTALNGQRIDLGENHNFKWILVSNDTVLWQTNYVAALGPDSTPLLLDYDEFHPHPPQSGKNVVYMDGHAAVYAP